MAAVAYEIDETSDAVQLNGFFGKTFNFYNLFSQSATLPLYLFVCLSIYIFYLTIFQPWIFSVQGFSLNFARILGRAVDKLLHASKVNSHGQFIFWKQSLSLFRSRGNTALNKTEGVISHIFKTWSKLDCSFLFCQKCTMDYKICELNIPFGLNEIYATWTVHFRRREFF